VVWPTSGKVSLPKSILIVDDSPAIRKSLQLTLEDHGWQVCGEAVNGRDGVEKALQLKPDLVVLDLAMPVINGIEAAQELRRLLPSVTMLMFTSFETDGLKQLASAAGVNAIVSKSHSVDVLVSSVKQLL
jgi:DNA-binding NarL/FixJ family response regulator